MLFARQQQSGKGRSEDQVVEDGGVLPGQRQLRSQGDRILLERHKKTWWEGDVQECTRDGSSRDWSEGRRAAKSGNTVGPDNISGDWKWLKMGAAEFPTGLVNNVQR